MGSTSYQPQSCLLLLQGNSNVSLPINRAVSAFHQGRWGNFPKKASLGYFLSVDPSNSSHVSNSLCLSLYGRMSSPPPPGEKGLEPCLAGLRSEGRGRTGLPPQQKSLQKSGPARERLGERSGGRTSWEEV